MLGPAGGRKGHNVNTVEKICALLEKKKQLFLEYEQATKTLLECDADAAEHYITQRSELATKVDEVTEEIGRICDKEEYSELLMNIAAGQTNFEDVPTEYKGIFTQAQEVRGIAYRISTEEPQVLQRLGSLRTEAEVKIRENQHLPKIKKYLTDLNQQPGTGAITDGKA